MKLKHLLPLVFMVSCAAMAQTGSYLVTSINGAQTQVDVNHTSFFVFTVPSGGVSFAGGKLTMKTGNSTQANITFQVFPGSVSVIPNSGQIGAVTLNANQFCGGQAPCGTFEQRTLSLVGGPVVLSPGIYTAILSSNAPDVQSQSYFVKNDGTSSLSNPSSLQPILQKTFLTNPVQINTPTEMILQLSNFSGSPVTGVGFTDALPGAMDFSSQTVTSNSCGGSATISGSTLTVSGITLAGNASCSIQVPVQANSAGSITNTTSTVSPNGTAAASATLTATVTTPPPGGGGGGGSNPSNPVETPTLGEWGMIALLGLLGCFGVSKVIQTQNR